MRMSHLCVNRSTRFCSLEMRLHWFNSIPTCPSLVYLLAQVSSPIKFKIRLSMYAFTFLPAPVTSLIDNDYCLPSNMLHLKYLCHGCQKQLVIVIVDVSM